MKGLPPIVANSLWQALSTPSWHQFRRALTDVENEQRRILKNYLRVNQNTDYGRRHDFASISSIDAFQESVPLTTYEDYLPQIDAIGRGQPMVLTADRVLMFEMTSGSTSASKMIPYTQSLRSEFQRAIAAWIVDLFRYMPDLKKGPAYWSITPLIEGRSTTPGGIPIGFEEDSDYLGIMGKRLVDAAQATPHDVKNAKDVETFRYLTLLFLLRQPGLRMISIWNPTFLDLLLDPLSNWWPALLQDIADGTISPPGPIQSELQHSLLPRLTPDLRRARELESLRPNEYEAIWPYLNLLSCWMDGSAASYAEELQSKFPRVFFQGKGLIATEAFVSFPMIGVQGSVLAVTAHFYEFLPVDSQTLSPTSLQPKLAHQLEEGQVYSVIVTTGGGLYRYQLDDLVKVVDHHKQAPCLRFLGKGDKVSDWFGEKLNELFVAGVLDDLMSAHQLSPRFAMLAPNDSGDSFNYTLYLELGFNQRDGINTNSFAVSLDQKLRQNFHYDYCRKLGQIAAPDVFLIDQGAREAYLYACGEQGQRLGDIKPSSLQKTVGWDKYFSGSIDLDYSR